MRATLLRFGSLLLATSVAVSACGDDSSTDAQSQFNEFEANQVLTAVANAIENVDVAAGEGIAAAVESINTTVNCAVAGTANVIGTRDPGPAVDFDARVQYVNCASVSVTINGFLDITATSSIPTPGTVKITWTFKGSVTSAKDNRTRTCSMDVTRVRTISSSSNTTTVNGNVCNRTINS